MNEKDILLIEQFNRNIGHKDTELSEVFDAIIRLFRSIPNTTEEELGPKAIPFDAAMFAGDGSGITWTVASTDVNHYTYYMIRPDLMWLHWSIKSSTLGGVAGPGVILSLPKGYGIKKVPSGGVYQNIQGWGLYHNNGVYNQHTIQGASGGTAIALNKHDLTNYVLAGGLQSYGGVLLLVTK